MTVRSARCVALLPAALAALLAASVTPVRAQTTIFNQVHTIASASVAVPQEYQFSVSAAGNYGITLTDLGAALNPSAPLYMVQLAVTSSADQIVGTPLVGAGTLTLSLATGDYVIHVIGQPGGVPGSGPFGITVVDTASMTQIAAFQGTLALPSQALPNGLAVIDDTFQLQAASGQYTVSLTDLQVPQSLSALGLLLIPQGGATPVITLPTASNAYAATVTLTQGVTYSIIAYGQADPMVNAGLFSAVVAPGAGGPGVAPVYGRAEPVGSTVSLGSPGLKAGSATFTLTDLKYPAALTQLEGVLTLTGQPVAQLGTAGSKTFTAMTGTYQMFAAGTANTAPPGTGAFDAQVMEAGVPPFEVAQGVAGAGSLVTPYSFATTIGTAGSYTLSITDFQFPAALVSLEAAAIQGGAVLGKPLTAAGNGNISAASGPLNFLVFAQAAAGGGLFGINLGAVNGGTSAFSVTQGVGALFSAAQFTVTTKGSYAATATDLGFPASFANFDTVVTQGTTRVGSIFGGGTFNFAADPGTYYINFIAQPSGAAQAGTYALTVGTAPPPPIVNLSTDNSSVSSGSTVDIIWSTKNAMSCTASGGWSGSQALSGTTTSAALTANTTFTLSCTGPGGTQSKSVSVTVMASGGGGHGGAIDAELLGLLGLLLALRAAGRQGAASARAVGARS